MFFDPIGINDEEWKARAPSRHGPVRLGPAA
jgi:hypothetical protein